MSKKILMACSNYWSSPFQVGSHHIARGFVKAGWKVAFISDPISPLHLLKGISQELRERYRIYRNKGEYEIDNSLWTYLPGTLLSPQNKPLLRSEWLHRHWFKLTRPNILTMIAQKGFDEVDLLYFDSVYQLFWRDNLHFKKSIFRVADNNTGFNKSAPCINRLEHELASSVDAVIYTAENLKTHVMEMGPREAIYFPNGVNFDHFANSKKAVPREYRNISLPIAIYVGAMDFWFDYDLLNFAVSELPHISFVLIGPEKLAQTQLKKRPNLYLLGRKAYSDLPSFLSYASVGIIPFNVGGYPNLVHSINPLKLYEYMACGLPVVSVEWKELRNINSPAVLTKTREEFIQGIDIICQKSFDKKVFINYAQKHDWTEKVTFLLEHLNI